MNNIIKLTSCAVVISILLAQPVLAKDTELAAKVQACSEINENEARLSCFDGLTNKATGVLTSEAAASLTMQQEDDFAKEHVKKTAEEKANEIQSISVIITKLSKTSHGRWKITFDNGQKWQQKDSTKMKLKQGEEVELAKGAFSSIFLQKEDSNKRIKVKRLK